MATTVILGSGIIGVSTAYYLLQHQPASTIHLVDSSPELFASASGYAGGFLAKDWFSPSVAALGALSYAEHDKLAEKEDGRQNWGYAKSVTVSYSPGGRRKDGKKGEDWLLEGTSRAGLMDGRREGGIGDVPAWLRREKGDDVSVVDASGGTAIVNPLKLCQFLLKKCLDAGVHLHNPATALSLTHDVRGELASVRIGSTLCSDETEIPATRILLSAGAWTPRVFASLFEHSNVDIPVSCLSGHSMVLRAPGSASPEADSAIDFGCHAVYAALEGIAPELYSRPNGTIYLAGVNSVTTILPKLATDASPDAESFEKLKSIAKELIVSDSELEVVRKGLCFRPVTPSGKPIITRLKDEQLGVQTRKGAEGGVFVASGHGPWGISLSLGTGKVAADLMQGRKTSADIRGLGL